MWKLYHHLLEVEDRSLGFGSHCLILSNENFWNCRAEEAQDWRGLQVAQSNCSNPLYYTCTNTAPTQPSSPSGSGLYLLSEATRHILGQLSQTIEKLRKFRLHTCTSRSNFWHHASFHHLIIKVPTCLEGNAYQQPSESRQSENCWCTHKQKSS